MSDTGHIKCPRCGKELPVSAPEGLCPACLGALNFATETELSGAEMREALPPLTPQELAPHFPQLEILECLGRGGMGVVYKARQRTLNRLVALKLLAPERVQDAKFADRFAREAQALAALNHPNIVTIHDFGKAGGFYYLLMEFVDGLNLRQLLRTRKLQPTEALAIVPPVCEALQYAHEHSIVHRDIKPENLLLAKDGRVKIADFGIAKMLGSDSTNSSISLSSPKGGEGRGEEVPNASATQQTTMGTPQYMAPEQREQPQNADHRTDIYALGVVLYELLTGELPTDKLQPPSKKVQIDVRLDEVVLRALEKTPALRYQTAGEFKTQVESVGVKSSEKNALEKDIASAATPNRGPLPRALKVIICWLLVQGGLALTLNLFNFISWGQVQVNLIGLNLAAGFGLMTLRTGWWRFALVMNGAQMLASLLGVPLALAPAPMWDRFLSPMEAFRTQPIFLAIWVLIQIVTITTCVLVHFNLLRLRRVGWFGPVAEEQKKIEYAIATVTFYTGIILGIVIIGLMPFRFSRDAAYLVVVGIMVALSPLVGMFIGSALRQAEQEKQTVQLTRIRRWLAGLSIVAWTLALPVVSFGIFFLFGSLSKVSGWNPATSEAVLIPLTWLGSMLLPWAAISLRSTSVKNVDRVWKIAGLLTLICLSLGLGLRQYESWQKDARRMAVEREAVASSAPAMVDRAVDHSPFIARLPYGGSVELLAVRVHPQNTNAPWWQPDGSPSKYGADVTVGGPSLDERGVYGLFKVNWPVDYPHDDIYGASFYSGAYSTLKGDLLLPEGNLMVVHFKNVMAGHDEATVKISVGVQPWKTAIVLKPGLNDFLTGGSARRKWDFSETPSGNLKVTGRQLFPSPNLENQLVAVDLTGKYHSPSASQAASWAGNSTNEYYFDATSSNTDELKANQVKEVYWQQRPFDTIEFRHVSLKPGHITKVEVNEFAQTNAVYPGEWIWEANSETLNRIPPIFLLRESSRPKDWVPFAIFGKEAYLARGKTLSELMEAAWSQRDSSVKVNFKDNSDGNRFDFIVTGQSKWWESLREELIRRFDLSEEISADGKSVTYSRNITVSYPTARQIVSPPLPAEAQAPVIVERNTRYFSASSILLALFLLGLGIGGLVLTIWLSRKKGLKGCLLAGAIMLGVLLGLAGLISLLSFGYRAAKANAVHAPAGTTLELRPISQIAPPPQPDGLAMQVQNGFRFKASGAQLVTFEFFMRQGDDRLVPLPQLTARLAMASNYSLESSIYWAGVRGDNARSTNQLWSWSAHAYGQTQQPLPSRPDYETNLTYHLRPGEVLNWWQLAQPAQVNLFPGSSPQDIPLFRTFGSATLDPKQPKEAIVRVTCEALPAGYQFGREQYELLLGTKNNKTAGTDGAKVNPTELPRSLVPQSVVDEARAEAKRAAALFAAARTTRTEVLDAEYHLKWAEAMFNGDVRSALQAKRDGAALKLESINLLIKAGRGSTADRAKAVRELAEAEAAMAQLSQAKPSALVDDQPVPTKRLVIKSVQDLADVKGARRPSSQTQEVTNTRPGAISLRSTTPLLPGESITAHLRYPDGHLEDAGASYIVSHAQGEDRPSLSLFWSVPPGFSSTQQNSMLAQMKAHEQSGFLTLTQGVPTTVFSITNTAGMVVCGEAQYECHEQAPEAVFLHLGRIFSINDRNLLVYFTAGMSSGSLLRASVLVDGKDTGESDLQLSLSRSKSMNGNLSWKIPPVMETNATALAMAQVETLIKQGPIRLLPGARQTVFKLTNTLGVTLEGCLELLPSPGTPTRAVLRSQVDARVVSAEKLMAFETVGASGALISATSATPFEPGEKLVVRTRMSNGHFEEAVPYQTMTRYDLTGYTFTILQWRLPETFLSQAEEVSRQLQRFQQARLLALPPGVPVNVFTVTNSAGITLMGELLYRRELVGTSENARTAEIQITSSAAVSGAPWVYFKASVPVGCQLLARKESSTDRPGETSINQENAIWRWTSGMSEAEASEALRQVSAFAARGPFNVSLGKPTELFSVTNSAGEVFSGSLELVGNKP